MANVPAIRPGSGASSNPRAAGPARPAAPTGCSFAAHLKGPLPLSSSLFPSRTTQSVGTRAPQADPGLGTASDALGKSRPRAVDEVGVADDRPPRRSASLVVDPLDPMVRALFSQGLAGDKAALAAAVSAPQADTVAVASRVSLEHVMSRFVRRVAWSGDAHSGTARLELGAGALEGATLTIRSDHGAVSVSLELPPGVDPAEWRDRIARRLAARGLQVAAVDVE
jgi:hypothetical protein